MQLPQKPHCRKMLSMMACCSSYSCTPSRLAKAGAWTEKKPCEESVSGLCSALMQGPGAVSPCCGWKLVPQQRSCAWQSSVRGRTRSAQVQRPAGALAAGEGRRCWRRVAASPAASQPGVPSAQQTASACNDSASCTFQSTCWHKEAVLCQPRCSPDCPLLSSKGLCTPRSYWR